MAAVKNDLAIPKRKLELPCERPSVRAGDGPRTELRPLEREVWKLLFDPRLRTPAGKLTSCASGLGTWVRDLVPPTLNPAS